MSTAAQEGEIVQCGSSVRVFQSIGSMNQYHETEGSNETEAPALLDAPAAVPEDESPLEAAVRLELPPNFRLQEIYDPEDELLELTCCELKQMPVQLLEALPNLKTLLLRQNPVALNGGEGLTPITALQSLTHLDLYETELEKITGIQSLLQLRHLDLSYNGLRSFKDVQPLTQLEQLYLVRNKITSMEETLLSLPELTLLEFGHNRVKEIENLDNCTKLDSLWLGKNKITKLAGLQQLTCLRVLSMQSNRIVKIEGLSALVGLKELYLSHNGIERIEELHALVNLTVLDLAGNLIPHIENVECLQSLEDFWFNDNKLFENLDEIDKLAACPKMATIYLYGTQAWTSAGTALRSRVKALIPQIQQIDDH